MDRVLESASCSLVTEFGTFRLRGFKDPGSGFEHAAMTVGNLTDGEPVLTRIHSECLTGDVFHSLHCDCGTQLDLALRTIAKEGRGALLYLRQEGRGIGLLNKIRAYNLQQHGADTVDANRLLGLPDDARDYAIAADILRGLGVTAVNLMTNDPQKIRGLEQHGISVAERIPLEGPRGVYNRGYLDTKARRMGHLLAAEDTGPLATKEEDPSTIEGSFCCSASD